MEVLLDALDQITLTHADAVTAVLTRHDGWTYTFAVFKPTSDPMDPLRHARLIEIADRNGNAITLFQSQINQTICNLID